MICSAVLIQYTRVTDRRTDRRNWRGIYALQLNAVARKKLIIIIESFYKKLSYCWETVRRESMLRIAEMDVEMTT